MQGQQLRCPSTFIAITEPACGHKCVYLCSVEPKYRIDDRVAFASDKTEHGWDAGVVVLIYPYGDSYMYLMEGKPMVKVKEEDILGYADPENSLPA